MRPNRYPVSTIICILLVCSLVTLSAQQQVIVKQGQAISTSGAQQVVKVMDTQGNVTEQTLTTEMSFSFYDKDAVIPDSVRIKTFEFVTETIRQNYYDSTFSDLDWNQISQQYFHDILKIKQSAAYHQHLNKMINELGKSHLNIIPPHIQNAPKAKQRTFTVCGLDVRGSDEGDLIYTVEEGTEAAEYGLRAGDRLLKIDGAEVVSGRAPTLLKGDSASACRILYLDQHDKKQEAVLHRFEEVLPTMTRLSRARTEYRRLDKNLGYIKVDIWGFNVADQIDSAMAQLMDTKGLIIDVRHNPGGIGAGSDRLIEYISRDSVVTGHQIFRGGVNVMLKTPGSGQDAYEGKIAVLTDERSGSNSELLAATLQESGRAAVVGENSYGGVLNATQEMLPTGGTMLYPNGAMYTAKKRLLEGIGVNPDYKVKLSRDDLYKGIDSVIEAAKKFLAKI